MDTIEYDIVNKTKFINDIKSSLCSSGGIEIFFFGLN